MVSFVSQIVVVLMNRVLSDGPVNWLRVRWPHYPEYLVIRGKSNSEKVGSVIDTLPYDAKWLIGNCRTL